MPRSFEMLERVGVGTAIADVGRPAGLARLGSNGGWLGKITGFTSARLSQYVPTAVGQNIVEAHLCARYLELGGKILRAARVTGVSEDDTAADEGGRCTVAVERYVYVRPPAQAPPLPPALAALTSTSLSARFAVGADGKQSMVRESLGLGYEGHEYAQSFFLADVELEEGVAEATGWERGLHAVIEADGAFLLFIRLQGNVFRTYYCAAGMEPEQCTQEFLKERWAAKVPGGFPLKITRFEAPSTFSVSCRLVTHYASPHGKVFLAGDAAHCHSPAGGQGMNTGLQDAANLGWKLAAVVKGEASAAKLLPTYEAERRPVAQWVLSTTDKTFAGITTASSPALAVARNWLIKTVLWLAPEGALPPAFIRDKAFGTSITYRDSGTCLNSGAAPPGGSLVAGDRLPDLLHRSAGSEAEEPLYRRIGGLSTKLTLIVVAGGAKATERAAVVAEACGELCGGLADKVLLVRAKEEEGAASPGGGSPAVDVLLPVATGGSLAAELKLKVGGLAILAVRPDTYLAVVHRGPVDAGIEKFTKALGSAATVAASA
mmetsp:Transcript_15686/g.46933  ORF Transcript_15686/g.46933 Transcript_15686/m.46933 type:complete len:547 (+) Transcript_15686:284-1924(+)